MSAAIISFSPDAAKPVAMLRHFYEIAEDSLRGLAYWWAAERDEKDGFPFTAAWEWQKAAECFGWISVVADRCWQEWERIVHLPRRLAGPIGEFEAIAMPRAMVTPDNVEIAAPKGLVFALDSRAS